MQQSIKVFTEPGHLPRIPPSPGSTNEKKPPVNKLMDEELIVRLNLLASSRPFCAYIKVRKGDIL
jgi:hypothetical protein